MSSLMRRLRAVTFICAPPTPPCLASLDEYMPASSFCTNSSSLSDPPASES